MHRLRHNRAGRCLGVLGKIASARTAGAGICLMPKRKEQVNSVKCWTRNVGTSKEKERGEFWKEISGLISKRGRKSCGDQGDHKRTDPKKITRSRGGHTHRPKKSTNVYRLMKLRRGRTWREEHPKKKSRWLKKKEGRQKRVNEPSKLPKEGEKKKNKIRKRGWRELYLTTREKGKKKENRKKNRRYCPTN